MNKEEKLKEQKKKAQKKYWETHREYYRKQSLNEAKRVRQERRLYKGRISKAIEWIFYQQEHSMEPYIATDTLDDLLEILKGEDKE